jgi:uncharacterized RDD family membrane protein YckC
VEGDFQVQDQRFAEWYVWAKREISTDSGVSAGAAQAAAEALDEGGDDEVARKAARRSTSGHGIGLTTRVPPRRRAYAEWYDWARRELGGGRERQHEAARAAIAQLDSGGDAAQAAAAARAVAGPAAPAPGSQPGWASPPEGATPTQPGPAAAVQMPAPPAYGPHGPYVQPAAPIPAPAPDYAYAGFWRRGGAWLIDTVLLTVVFVVMDFVGSAIAVISLVSSGQDITNDNATGIQFALLVIMFVLAWLYYAGLESSPWQGTVGKRLLKLVVTDMHGERITFGRASGRYFGKILSALIALVGYIMVAFTQRKQGLHDLLAGTLVVRQEYLALLTAAQAPPPPPQPSPGPAGPTTSAGPEVQQGA